MRLVLWVWVAVLVGSVLAVNQITLVTEAATLGSMKAVCSGAPVSNLNLCNNTCRECSSSSSYKCANCNDQLRVAGDLCQLDNSIHSYTIYNYLRDLNADLMIADLAKFKYTDTNTPVGPNKVVEICSTNTYELFMAGPFKDTSKVGIYYEFTDKIDRIQIKFNFMALIADITLFVNLNDNNAFKKKFNIFSDLQGTYGKNPNDAGPNYMFLSALTASNVGSVITPVDTGLQTLVSNSIKVELAITTSEPGYSWGFSDFVVIQRACETCVSKAVTEMMDSVGSLCWAVLLVVVCLLVLLFVMIKLEDLKRKWDHDARLGSADALPLKAINRILDSLQRSARAMQKEFRREDRNFKRLTKPA